MDREGDDVALVDHQPHPAVGRDLVTDPGHEVLGEPVGLEVVAVGLGRPWRVEAGLLDGVDRRQVVDPHRLDEQPHRGSRDHATSPPSDRTPRGKVTYSGTSPARSSTSPAARRAAPSETSAAPSPARAASPRSSASSGARPARSRATSEASAGEVGVLAGPEQPRRRAAPDEQPIRRARPAAAGRRPRGAPASSASAVETPTIGTPSAWARPLAVAIPTRRPVNAPGPVPTTMAASRDRRDVRLAKQRGDGRQERLAVAVAGRPVGRLDQLAGRRADGDDHPGRGAVDGQDDGSRRLGVARGGHGTTVEIAPRTSRRVPGA